MRVPERWLPKGKNAIRTLGGALLGVMLLASWRLLYHEIPAIQENNRIAQDTTKMLRKLNAAHVSIQNLNPKKVRERRAEAQRYLFTEIETVTGTLQAMVDSFPRSRFNVRYTVQGYAPEPAVNGVWRLRVIFNATSLRMDGKALPALHEAMNRIALLPRKHRIDNITVNGNGSDVTSASFTVTFWTTFNGQGL